MGNELAVILGNLVGVVGGAIVPITWISYVIGLVLLGTGIMALRRYGDDRQGAGAKPFMTIIVGVTLLSIGTAVSTMSESIFGSGTKDLLSQVPSGGGVLDGYIRFAVTLVIVVGFYCVIKGLLKLKNSGEGRDDQFWSGCTHIGGGLICCNIVTFAKMIGSAAGGVVQELVSKLFG